MTLYQQEMLRKLGRLDCAGRYDEEKGLLVISSGGTGLCCQDKKGYLSWESEKIRTEEEKAVLSQIGEQAKLIRAYVGQYENSPSMGIPEVEGYRRMAECGDIKRFLAIYFGASMNGDQMPDVDGEQFYEVEDDEEEN